MHASHSHPTLSQRERAKHIGPSGLNYFGLEIVTRPDGRGYCMAALRASSTARQLSVHFYILRLNTWTEL